MKHKVCTLIGTRPEAIKLAPVIKELKRRADRVDSLVIVTAQHREMLDQVLKLFSIKSKYDLDIMRPGQSLFDVTRHALVGLKPVLEKEKPDMLIIQGDTTTVLIGGLAAFYLKIPIAHVEAGLRTKDKYQPFPEEINRRLATVLADLHFAPTVTARNNLLKEGIKKDHIYVTGNTVIDAMLSVLDKNFVLKNTELAGIDFRKKRMILVTAHRRENWGKPLADICKSVKKIVSEFPDVIVVFSVHPNPAVQKTVHEHLSGVERTYLLKPLDYDVFVNLMARAHIILTDSGGIQEEAPLLGKPVLVLRNLTERQEAVNAGAAKLVGADPENIFSSVSKLLNDRSAYKAMIHHDLYGRGKASRKIADVILSYLSTAQPLIHKPVGSIEPPLA